MMKTQSSGDTVGSNRDKILDAANELIYHKGYFQTSFNDIADVSGVSKGNFYHHFRSKEDLLSAIIARRKHELQALLAQWSEQYENPKDALKRYVEILLNEQNNIISYGCPMGSLSAELGKDAKLLQANATSMMSLCINWLSTQFTILGHQSDARNMAMHLMSRLQGTSLLTNVYEDRAFLTAEVQGLKQWVDTL